MATPRYRCRHCGAAVGAEERFCGECGRPLEHPAHAPPSTATASASPPSPPPPRATTPTAPSRHAGLVSVLIVLLAMSGFYFAWGKYIAPRLKPGARAPASADSMAVLRVDSTPARNAAAGPQARPAATGTATNESAPLVTEEAVRWADANSFERYQAQQQLREGLAYLYGQGVPVDYGRARRALEAAASVEGAAAFQLYRMYGLGMGVIPDVQASFLWLQRAATLGDAEGQYTLGRFYFDGSGRFLAPDHVLSAQWLRAAAAQGHEGAQAFLREQGWDQ